MNVTPSLDDKTVPFADGSRARFEGVAALAPIFVLAPPRSFTSIVCAMLGQHPQLYGFPETQLFTTETIAGKLRNGPLAGHRIRDGLLRVVAQLYIGEQTQASVRLARGWLLRRSHFNTGYVFELLAERVYPLIPVEKSPDIVYDIVSLQRTFKFFPQARFIHLLRHPRGYCDSNLRYYRALQERGQRLPPWMFCSAADSTPGAAAGNPNAAGVLDPQKGWLSHNMRIRRFFESVPNEQKTWIRGEDLLTDPDQRLRQIADWIGLRTDPEALEQMKHPERSPYAFIGPPNARYGNSRTFLENPTLRPDLAKPYSLDGPLPWREDGQGFLPEVRRLASEFGYS